MMSDQAHAAAKPDQPDKPGKEHQVTILVNNRPIVLHDDKVTGAEIKAAAGVPPDFKLYDPAGHEIGNEERIKIKDGQRFTAISGQDVS